MRERASSHDKASTSAGREQVEQLKRRWPGREQLVEQLALRLTSTGSSEAPLFVFGPPATGKTAVVRCGVGPGAGGREGRVDRVQDGRGKR